MTGTPASRYLVPRSPATSITIPRPTQGRTFCYNPANAVAPNPCPAGSYAYGGTCAYTHTNWNELPQQGGRGVDFFGGDLAGINQEIDPYLKQTLGVNAL